MAFAAGMPPAVIDHGAWQGGEKSVSLEFAATTLNVGVIDPELIQPVIDALRAAGLTIRRLQPFRQTLESLFMETVTDPLTGQAMTPGADRPRSAGYAQRPAPCYASLTGGSR